MDNLTFKQLVTKIEAIKDQYKGTLSLFSCGFDIKKKVEYTRKAKNTIYLLKIEKWQSDRIWNYMNDDLSYEELLEIANRQNIK